MTTTPHESGTTWPDSQNECMHTNCGNSNWQKLRRIKVPNQREKIAAKNHSKIQIQEEHGLAFCEDNKQRTKRRVTTSPTSSMPVFIYLIVNFLICIIWHNYLNFNKIYRFHETRSCSKITCIKTSPCCWDNLSTPTMNSISMKCDIMNIETASTHVFITQDTLKAIEDCNSTASNRMP